VKLTAAPNVLATQGELSPRSVASACELRLVLRYS
jgi:hypothetical protein